MKFIYYFLLLLLYGCSTAQNLQVIKAVNYTRIGGVKGSRAEIYQITVKNDSKLNVKSLQLGEAEIPLSIKTDNGSTIFTGTYFPEDQAGPQTGETAILPKPDLKAAFLITENPQTKTISRQKISFSTLEQTINNNEDVPE